MALVDCIEQQKSTKIGYVVSLWTTDSLYIVKDTNLKGLAGKVDIDCVNNIYGFRYKNTLYKVATLYKVTKYLDEDEADVIIEYYKNLGIDAFKEPVYENINTITTIRHEIKRM